MTTDKSADADLLKDVFSSSRDRGADSAAPKSEPEVEKAAPAPDPQEIAEPETEQPDEPKGRDPLKGYRDPSTGRLVPLTELQSEREKRQEAQKAREEEARLRTQAEENARRYQAQLAEMERRIQAAQNPPQPPPDAFTDPEGWQKHIQATFAEQLAHERANMSELRARDKWGDETVNSALKAAISENLGPRFMQMRDPYGALINWHKQATALQKIGPDPEAYEKQVEERIRAKVLEELKAPASSKPQQRFPTSLADATATGAQGTPPVSDGAIAADVFSSARRRR